MHCLFLWWEKALQHETWRTYPEYSWITCIFIDLPILTQKALHQIQIAVQDLNPQSEMMKYIATSETNPQLIISTSYEQLRVVITRSNINIS